MPERYDAVVIEESKTQTNDDDSPRKFFTNVGAAFPHKNGDGITVLIRPGLSVHGELVLFPPGNATPSPLRRAPRVAARAGPSPRTRSRECHRPAPPPGPAESDIEIRAPAGSAASEAATPPPARRAARPSSSRPRSPGARYPKPLYPDARGGHDATPQPHRFRPMSKEEPLQRHIEEPGNAPGCAGRTVFLSGPAR